MSREYDAYLEAHKTGVAEGFRWLQEHLPDLFDPQKSIYFALEPENVDLEHQICFAHDASKNDPEEYAAYDAYFYGGNRSFEVVEKFRYAWLRHIHRNPHHWNYWVLMDEGKATPLDMPYRYIIEMICDWWSFSWREGSLGEIFGWYGQHRATMILSSQTRMIVEDILRMMQDKLVATGAIMTLEETMITVEDVKDE